MAFQFTVEPRGWFEYRRHVSFPCKKKTVQIILATAKSLLPCDSRGELSVQQAAIDPTQLRIWMEKRGEQKQKEIHDWYVRKTVISHFTMTKRFCVWCVQNRVGCFFSLELFFSTARYIHFQAIKNCFNTEIISQL